MHIAFVCAGTVAPKTHELLPPEICVAHGLNCAEASSALHFSKALPEKRHLSKLACMQVSVYIAAISKWTRWACTSCAAGVESQLSHAEYTLTTA